MGQGGEGRGTDPGWGTVPAADRWRRRARVRADDSVVAQRGAPQLEELAGHAWVEYAGLEICGLDALVTKAERSARVVADDMTFLREAIKHGAGIGLLPSCVAEPDVAAGTLLPVVPEFAGMVGHVYLLHHGGDHLSAKVVAFRDLLMELLQQKPLTSEQG
ncbi:LysR substrate-binding domain-containing protein [Sorangium sp. So ce726]|uniref:LysR substrate-binding domain-containing protein n=1 Tax=Sorangium sp. So ce726 TaxID=3133319 RepID=UPI003F634149